MMFPNAWIRGNVPYYREPEFGSGIIGYLDACEYVEITSAGGRCGCWYHIDGKGWIPFGCAEFINEVSRRQFHPHEQKRWEDR